MNKISTFWSTVVATIVVFIIGGISYCSEPRQYIAPTALVKVPLSGAAFINPEVDTQAPVPANNDERLKRIEALLERVVKLLEADAAPDGPAQPAADIKGQNNLKDALGTCTDCHNDRDAIKKGERFVLFNVNKDGQNEFRDDFSKRELKKIQTEVTEGTMPRKSSGKKLTPEQKAALLEEIKARTLRADQ